MWLFDYLGGRRTRQTKTKLFGFDNDFTPDQSDRNVPFEEGFIKSSDVYSINMMIAKNTKAIPWILKKKTGDKIEDVTSGRLYDLIKNPNKDQTLEEFKEEASLFYTISGNLFTRGLYSLGYERPTEIINLNPQTVQINVDESGDYNSVKNFEYYHNGKKVTLKKEEVAFLKYANPTLFGLRSQRGLSPLVAGYLTMIGLNGNQVASASIYKHQGAAGILSSESEFPLTPDERQKQQEILDKDVAGATLFGRIIQSSAKIKYTQLGLTPSQLKLIESKVMKVRDLCNIYDVNSALMNDPDNKVYSNVSQAEKSFYTKAVIPNDKALIKQFEKAVIDKFNAVEFPNGKSKYYLEQDLSGIDVLQADKSAEATKNKTNAEAYSIMLKDGVINKEQYALLMEVAYTPAEDEQSQQDKIINSQVTLRGTVGGVDGLININASVSNGLITRDSAVNIVVNIYGFTPEEANSMITTAPALTQTETE